MRIVACGQTMAHLPQSMQTSGSQIGMVWAMARFSYLVVPLGKVPSTGSALTGSRSPSPAITREVKRATKSGTSTGTGGVVGRSLLTLPSGTCARRSSELSMARKLRWTMASPRLAYVFSTKALIRAIASSAGRIPASWKKHGCMMVLIRLPMPASSATATASITQKSISLSRSSCWTPPGR